MEIRILKADGTLGKRIYKADVPAEMYALKRKLNKPLIGIGQWRNLSEKFLAVLPASTTNLFFSEDVLKEILNLMKHFVEVP